MKTRLIVGGSVVVRVHDHVCRRERFKVAYEVLVWRYREVVLDSPPIHFINDL